MQGLSWDERGSDYWLASNGRWYAPDQYPGGWDTTSLPPAPEHRGRRSAASMITERTKRLRDTVSEALEDAADRSSDEPAEPAFWTSSPPPPRPTTGARAGGPSAATVTATTAYNSRLASGAPPPPALGAAEAGEPDDDFPDPPGRLTPDDAPTT